MNIKAFIILLASVISLAVYMIPYQTAQAHNTNACHDKAEDKAEKAHKKQEDKRESKSDIKFSKYENKVEHKLQKYEDIREKYEYERCIK